MAARGGNSIKGITVEIGGETQGLQKALADVNQQSRSLYSELKQVDRMLQLDPGNVTLLAQRQQILNQQVTTTQEKLTRLRSVYAQVEEQFNRGDLGEEAWRRFQREVITTETRLQGFQRELELTETSAREHGKKIGESLKAGLSAVVAGEGIHEVVSQALEASDMTTDIKVSMDLDEAGVKAVQNGVNIIKSYGVDGETALAGVRKQWQLNSQASDEVNTNIIKYAGVIAKSYKDIDFTEIIQESNEMAAGMNITQTAAIGLTNHLLKMGFPPDQLDIISEYGTQLHRAGFEASQIGGILEKGVKVKNWNIDNLLDGLKEGRVQMAAFSQGVDKTTAGLLKSAGISQQQFQQWGADVAAGGQRGSKAMLEVGKALDGVGNAGVKNALGIKIFGTMFEDSGDAITKSLAGGAEAASDLDANVRDLTNSSKQIDASPTVALGQALGQLNIQLQPVYQAIAGVVGQLAAWIQANPQAAATLAAVTVALGILVGICAALAPVLTVISAVLGVMGIEVAAITAPVWLAIGAFAALIAIGVLVAANWNKIKAQAISDWNELTAAASAMGNKIAAKFRSDLADFIAIWVNLGVRIKNKFNSDVEDIKRIASKIGDFFRNLNLEKVGEDIMNGLRNGIANAAGAIYSKAKEIAGKVISTLKHAFDTKSPSRLTHEIGLDVGAGLGTGIEESFGSVKNTSVSFANRIIEGLRGMFTDKDNSLVNYFQAIQEDGDYLNDWLTHMPKQIEAVAKSFGKLLAPQLEGTRNDDPNAPASNDKYLTVNITSPKALDARAASKELTRTMNNITKMW